MAEKSKIKAEEIFWTEGTLKRWLNGRSKQDAVFIAHRTALRVLPFYGAEMEADWAREKMLSTLPQLRVALSCAATVSLPKPDIYYDVAIAAQAATDARSAATESAIFVALAAAIKGSNAVDPVNAAVDAETSLAARAGYDVWATVRSDAMLLERGENPLSHSLWPDQTPEAFAKAEQQMLRIWQAAPDNAWDFWQRWWNGAKEGRYPNPQLLLEIAQIDDEDLWNEPAALAKQIAEIEKKYWDSEPEGLERALASQPTGQAEAIAKTRQAIIQNRAALPHTFNAILSYIKLEIERLQGINYQNEAQKDEAVRQIGVLTTIHDAVSRLSALVPTSEEMSQEDAEQAESLSRLIYRRFSEWPRSKPGVYEDNISEMVDSSCRGAIVGGLTAGAILMGAPATPALIAGAIIFGGKKVSDAAKQRGAGAKD